MIKVDYEGAWKELKEYFNGMAKSENRKHQEYNVFGLNHFNMMDNFEQKHTRDYIDIKKRSDKEVADYCLKKYAEVYLELVELKQKLKEFVKDK